MIENLPHIDIDSLQDESVKSDLRILLNLIESQQKTILEQSETIRQLKDEINILKGEQGRPNFKKRRSTRNISSEAHMSRFRKKRKRKKEGKKKDLPIDRREICEIDRTKLPKDAVFKRYETLIQQNLVFGRVNTEYRIEIWYSPSEKKTYRSRPKAYSGYFGDELKSFALRVHNFANVTQSKLLELLRGMNIEISAGSLQNILSSNEGDWIKEKQDIVKSGLQDSYTQTDSTDAKVAGKSWHTHILCSNNFMSFSTLERKSRRHLLYALQGEPENGLKFIYTETTKKYLEHFNISKTHKRQLKDLFKSKGAFTEQEFKEKISISIPDLAAKKTTFNWVCDAFAFGYYHYQQDYQQVNILISDNAPEYKLIADEHGLCWVHDARNYNKLSPFVPHHKEVLKKFQDNYWAFYKSLLNYKEKPSQILKTKIIAAFDQLFVANTDYFDLNKQIKKTLKNKKKLLTVLDNPQIPLHNNLSELGARCQVRKRDVCLHTMTHKGTKLQDAFMTIYNTCKMNGINPYTYIKERLSGTNEIYLPDLVLSNIRSG